MEKIEMKMIALKKERCIFVV